ncbi:MAG: (Fe-S)-binding protein [Bacteroidota bacterium]
MVKQIVFAITLIATIAIFIFTLNRISHFFSFTRPAYPIRDFGKRLWVTLEVAFGQTIIFRRPVIGFLHALVFWGFCVIAFGSIEMVIDGLFGTDRFLKFLGPVYDVITASGDIFGLLVGVSILIFIFRRLFLHIKRFDGIEMKPISHMDANLALSMILFLMISLLGMNMAYYAGIIGSVGQMAGMYPVSRYFSGIFVGLSSSQLGLIYEICWWSHILLIFIFANVLPYSKHFHVFMSIPNVFLSRLEPLGKLPNMESITREVTMMLHPETIVDAPSDDAQIQRFGVKDAEDVSWKNYFDSLACTECGRCTSVCPANLTGKRLSPRKIIMDLRARMKEKGPGMIKHGRTFTDNRSLLRDYISEEELWACTTCNACAKECPININHPTLIVDMRRFLVMEEASAPSGIKWMFSNIENNGAAWQFSPDDRMLWAQNIELHKN